MKALITVLAVAAGTLNISESRAADGKRETPAQARTRVEVAVALAVAASATDCGQCITDEPDARAMAAKHRKPLVLIVGECGGRGVAAVKAGAVACIVREYDGSNRPRIVVLSPKPEGDGWFLYPPLPIDATDTDLTAAVAAAVPAPPKQMPAPAAKPAAGNWEVSLPPAPGRTVRYCTAAGCFVAAAPPGR